jgi:hypothetical protein
VARTLVFRGMNAERHKWSASRFFGTVVRHLTTAALFLSLVRCAPGGMSPRQMNDAVSPALGTSCASNEDCGQDGFCARPDGACAAPLGACANAFLNIACIAAPPVCGCDGKTYPGDCARTQAGVSKQHDGSCP